MAVARSNIDVVRDAWEAFSTGSADAMLPYIDPEFRGEVPPDASAEPDVYVGHAGVHRYLDLFAEVMEDLTFEPQEFIEAGEHLVVVCHVRGRGKGSGIEVEMTANIVTTVRDGLIVYMCGYPTMERALEAVGVAG
jgi:ketosteroid isomerase-like protein